MCINAGSIGRFSNVDTATDKEMKAQKDSLRKRRRVITKISTFLKIFQI